MGAAGGNTLRADRGVAQAPPGARCAQVCSMCDRIGTGPPRARTEVIYVDLGCWGYSPRGLFQVDFRVASGLFWWWGLRVEGWMGFWVQGFWFRCTVWVEGWRGWALRFGGSRCANPPAFAHCAHVCFPPKPSC